MARAIVLRLILGLFAAALVGVVGEAIAPGLGRWFAIGAGLGVPLGVVVQGLAERLGGDE